MILTSTIIVMLVGSYGWGWLADRLGRRKPLYMAGVSTLGLTLMGDTLDASNRKGCSMGFTRGLGSLAFAAGAFAGAGNDVGHAFWRRRWSPCC